MIHVVATIRVRPSERERYLPHVLAEDGCLA